METGGTVIIGVGNELLNGRTANTNAQWLSLDDLKGLTGTI